MIQIGVLTGFGPKPDLTLLQPLKADIHGIAVGSTAHLREVADFIALHDLPGIMDPRVEFTEATEALSCLRSGTHFGKVVLRIAKE